MYNTLWWYCDYFVISLLYNIKVNTAPTVPANNPVGDRDSYVPTKYSIAPPIYDPATPKATVFIKPKFSSPGTILLAMLPTNNP